MRRVLVVDHEVSTSKAITRIGRDNGFQTIAFQHSADFHSWVDFFSADGEDIANRSSIVVVFDTNFSNIFRNGIPPWFLSYPRIGISRTGRLDCILKSIRLGLFDFIGKPFHLSELARSIENAFEEYDTLQMRTGSFEGLIQRFESLTPRELEICELIGRGMATKAIAEKLGISIKTFYVHRTNLVQKTGTRSLIDLIRAYDIYASRGATSSGLMVEDVHAEGSDEFNLLAQKQSDMYSLPRVSDIACSPIIQISPRTSVREAVKVMFENNVLSLSFSREGKAYVFSMEDALNLSNLSGNFDLPISELSLNAAEIIGGNSNVLAALDRLEETGLRHLLVSRDNGSDNFRGIVSFSELLSSIDSSLFLDKRSVGEILFRKEPLTFTEEWILDDIIGSVLQTEDSVIVVDEGRPTGIITVKDIFRIISTGQSTDKALSHYMTTPIRTIPLNTSVHDVLQHLKMHRIKHAVIVANNGMLVGLLTQAEVISLVYGHWTRGIHHHVSKLQELVELLSKRATKYETESLTDSLTLLGNRRGLELALAHEVERVNRYKSKSFSLLFIDIDHFKRVNDQHGHMVGDEVLRAASDRIHTTIREADLVFRWGGEEFAVIAPCTEIVEANSLAVRIKQEIESYPFPNQICLTISVGIGEYTGRENLVDLFQRVDKALYRAKELGRNRVVISEQEMTKA